MGKIFWHLHIQLDQWLRFSHEGKWTIRCAYKISVSYERRPNLKDQRLNTDGCWIIWYNSSANNSHTKFNIDFLSHWAHLPIAPIYYLLFIQPVFRKIVLNLRTKSFIIHLVRCSSQWDFKCLFRQRCRLPRAESREHMDCILCWSYSAWKGRGGQRVH